MAWLLLGQHASLLNQSSKARRWVDPTRWLAIGLSSALKIPSQGIVNLVSQSYGEPCHTQLGPEVLVTLPTRCRLKVLSLCKVS